MHRLRCVVVPQRQGLEPLASGRDPGPVPVLRGLGFDLERALDLQELWRDLASARLELGFDQVSVSVLLELGFDRVSASVHQALGFDPGCASTRRT